LIRLNEQNNTKRNELLEMINPYENQINEICNLYKDNKFNMSNDDSITFVNGVIDFSHTELYKRMNMEILIKQLKKNITPLVNQYYLTKLHSDMIKFYGKLVHNDTYPIMPFEFTYNLFLHHFFYASDEKICNRIMTGCLTDLINKMKAEEYPNTKDLIPINNAEYKQYYFDNLERKIDKLIDIYSFHKDVIKSIYESYLNDEFVGSHDGIDDIEMDVFNYRKSKGYQDNNFQNLSKTLLIDILEIVDGDFNKKLYRQLQYMDELLDYDEFEFKEVLYVNLLDIVNTEYNSKNDTLSMDYALMQGDFINIMEDLIAIKNRNQTTNIVLGHTSEVTTNPTTIKKHIDRIVNLDKTHITLDQADFQLFPKLHFDYVCSNIAEYNPKFPRFNHIVSDIIVNISSKPELGIIDINKVINSLEEFYGTHLNILYGMSISENQKGILIDFFIVN